MTDNIKIEKQNIFVAYANTDDNGKALLRDLFPDLSLGKHLDNIMERIGTFDDAVYYVEQSYKKGDNLASKLLNDYHGIANIKDGCSPDVLAFLKLRIIAYALNEGWQPKFTTDEYRWYPWFELFTQQELDDMNEEQRSRVVARSYIHAHAFGGVAYADAHYAASFASTHYGSRLAFKSEELAEYCGKQFIDIWADFVFKVSDEK